MDLFEGYERDFLQLSSSIATKINALSKTTGDKKKLAVNEVEKDLGQAEKLLQSMETCHRTYPSSKQGNRTNKLKQCDSELSRLKQELQKAVFSQPSYSQDSFIEMEDWQGKNDNQRTQVLSGISRLAETHERLQHAARTASHASQLHDATIIELQSQEETLLSARNELDKIETNVQKSKRIIGGMTRRAMTNKIVLIIVIILLLVLLGFEIWWKVR